MKGNFTRIISFGVQGIFIALAFCYCRYFIDPSLIYFRQQPLFLFDKFFLYKYLSYTGGIADYLSLFISQLFISRLAGSILLALLIGITVTISYRILICFFPGNASFFLQFIPGLLLIYLHSHYEYDLRSDLIVVFALFFALGYFKIITRSPFIKVIVLLLSGCLLFFFFGATAFLLYTVLIILSEIYFKSSRSFWLLCVFQILIGFSLVLAVFISSPAFISIKGLPEKIFPELDKNSSVYLYVLFACIPFFLFIRVIVRYTLEKRIFYKRFIAYRFTGRKPVIMVVLSFIILVAAYFVCRISFDRPAKDAIQIHVFAAKGEWHKVLTIAKRLPMTDRKVIFEVNRALSHLGRLPDEAFNYAQYWGEKGLILTANYSSDVLMLCSDLYFDMGHIKESLHWAYEAQTKLERSPDVMKRIAMNNLILGEYKVAEKFFRILSKSFVHRKWAMHYLACLQDESILEKELLIQEKRKLLPSWNFYANAEKPQYDLFMLFSEHPENKMAFEYFMVYSMLANDLASVVQNINYLSAMHYHKIPVHIEEALVLFKALNEKYPVNLGKYRISSQMQERFVNYSKIIAVYHKDFKAAQPELFDKYGNTYWYYIQYISPLTTKREIHEKKQ